MNKSPEESPISSFVLLAFTTFFQPIFPSRAIVRNFTVRVRLERKLERSAMSSAFIRSAVAAKSQENTHGASCCRDGGLVRSLFRTVRPTVKLTGRAKHRLRTTRSKAQERVPKGRPPSDTSASSRFGPRGGGAVIQLDNAIKETRLQGRKYKQRWRAERE